MADTYTTNWITHIKDYGVSPETTYQIRDAQLWDVTGSTFVVGHAGDTYAVGDLVEYQGDVYQCIAAYTTTASSTSPSSDTTHWSNRDNLMAVIAAIEGSASTTDEKLKVGALTSGTDYFPILAITTDAGTAATRQIDKTYQSIKVNILGGSTTSEGKATLTLGNTTAYNVANNATGVIKLYSNYGDLYELSVNSPGAADNVNGTRLYLPILSNAAYGRLAAIPTAGTAVGTTTKPVYVNALGKILECSTYAGGTSVTLNGASASGTSITIYAPTSAGTSGQMLVSTGGAPAWKNRPSATQSGTTGITIPAHGTTSIKQFSTGGSFKAEVDANHVLSFTYTAATGSNVTVVTGTAHTVTDTGHTHSISWPT